MPKVNWGDLVGLQLATATGALFTVVRVSATHVAVRPRGGTRDYALSISQELEPAVAVYAAGNLPAPAELRHLGVRAVYTSYAWGLLKAVVQDRIGVRAVKRAKLKDFPGAWFITAMDDMGEDYWADEPEAPFIRLEVPRGSSGLLGEYVIGLSSGGIDGDLREFGGAAGRRLWLRRHGRDGPKLRRRLAATARKRHSGRRVHGPTGPFPR
ncbi:MAG: hypothetical protein IT317_06080 [Anaerolineales bacterium]|nr:hypothetical protein [Anaerolineales bacterium]